MTTVLEASNAWAATERGNDSAGLAPLLHPSFAAVGPKGFVLNRDQWLVRYESGLHNTAFDWANVEARDLGDVAFLIGVQTQRSTFQGRPVEGSFRVTQAWLRDGEQWKLASLQLSEIAPVPAA